MELPKYCQIVPHHKTGVLFVEVRGKWFIPNQGTTEYETQEDIVQNFWDWVRKNPDNAVQVCRDASLKEKV